MEVKDMEVKNMETKKNMEVEKVNGNVRPDGSWCVGEVEEDYVSQMTCPESIVDPETGIVRRFS